MTQMQDSFYHLIINEENSKTNLKIYFLTLIRHTFY